MQHWDINEVMTATEWLDIKSDQEYYCHLAQEQADAAERAKRGR